MEWLSQNWVWVLLIGGFVAMHLFGHGGHGGHGGGGGCGGGGGGERKPSDSNRESRPPGDGQAHRH